MAQRAGWLKTLQNYSVPTHPPRRCCYWLHHHHHHHHYLEAVGRNTEILVTAAGTLLTYTTYLVTTITKMILSSFYVPHTSLRTAHVVTHLILITILGNMSSSCFTDVKTGYTYLNPNSGKAPCRGRCGLWNLLGCEVPGLGCRS